MNALELTGKVATEYLRRLLLNREEADGVSRFLLDRLTGPQVAHICLSIISDLELINKVEIKIPRHLVEGFNLPDHILTEERTTHLRHAPCNKAAIILANTNDDQGQSLRDIVSIGASELKSECEIWVDVASKGVGLTDSNKFNWIQALKGLQAACECSLDQFSQYVVEVRKQIKEEGSPLIDALGWALPNIRLPRDSGYFRAIPDSALGQVKRWQKMYEQAIAQRGCLIQKYTSNRQIIESDELREKFEDVKDEIPDRAYPSIKEFIESEPGWTDQAEKLANFEWELDNINLLFIGLRTKKVDLATETMLFYEYEYPDTLLDDEISYLNTLKNRRTKESTDEDKEFYDRHRHELDKNRTLKAKWDRFIYGKPIECSDFLVGLLEAIERLFEQSENITGTKKLYIKTKKDNRKSSWLELNHDVGMYFCTRYKGLEKLTGPKVKWETHWLFKFDQLIEEERTKPRYKENTSTAKSAIQIHFYVELEILGFNGASTNKVQLIWQGNPNAIGMELINDLKRLQQSPFLVSQVNRELVNKKGRLQGVSLSDVSTLDAAFRQDRGSLIGPYDPSTDVSIMVSNALETALEQGRLTSTQLDLIKTSWDGFENQYKKAINDWLGEDGLSSLSLIEQCKEYEKLLKCLQEHALGDRLRIDLWQPVLNIGVVHVNGKDAISIIAPWHPMRLMAIAVKARQVTAIINHIIGSDNVDFGDSRMFFSNLKEELEHPYYPEICVGYLGVKPILLSLSDTVNDYSLMEAPVTEIVNQETNENPKEASNKILSIVKRYLELQPHERSNLSLVLFNCDSTRLPLSTVDVLSKLNDDGEEARCQIILRHSDTKKLNDLYEKMIEGSDVDPDMFVASEVSRDFMAKLRIEVMADMAPVPNTRDGKPADIIFLQDVISRQAKPVWVMSTNRISEDLIEHVPPRWSRKRPAARDELKTTVYLVCPKQPSVGLTYIEAVRCVIEGDQPNRETQFLPARQITFQDQKIVDIFEEVHKLGEWVVNYDDLLDRRQLKNQGVNVIKYEQTHTQGRTLIVSSTSQLNLLHALVTRRLKALNLPLSHLKISELAKRFIDEANSISGDIILRAAKKGIFASELIGVVLSKTLLRSEIGEGQPVGWYFLDDYAGWLGQKEQQIADILAISPKEISGRPYLQVLVSESKYVAETNLAEARRVSQKQLRDTIMRIDNAIFGNPRRLDRDLWLSRISDILLEGINFNQSSSLTLEEWRDGIRQGTIPIELRGYSHVFVSTSNEMNIESEILKIPNVNYCYQEIFNRDFVKKLILAYYEGGSLLQVRELLGDDRPWTQINPNLPVNRINLFNNDSESSDEGQIDVGTNEPANSLGSRNATVQPDPGSSHNNDVLGNPLTDVSADTAEGETTVTEEYDRNERTDDTVSPIPWAHPKLGNWIIQNQTPQITNEEAEVWLVQTVGRLKEALISYDFQAKVLGQRLTPNAAIVRLKGSDRLKVEDVERKRSQLLTTHALDIINVTPLPGEVVISVARPNRQVISLADVWKRRNINSNSAGINLSFVVGVKEVDGELLYLNLGSAFGNLQQHAPHTLIAGATGSGKSVLLQNLILDICATNSVDLAHIYLIDPKAGVDYLHIEELPHLREGIIIDQGRAVEIMEYLVNEMDNRYLKFREARVNNLISFNSRVSANERIPALWLIHDEFADWMLTDTYADAVSSTVQRLGVKARAAGIHLIFAAQRPDANVLPVQLRDNLGNRLVLRVESIGTSEIALGERGAERLLGKGHLVARLSGEPDLIYAQVPYLSSGQLFAAAQAIKTDKLKELKKHQEIYESIPGRGIFGG